MLTLIDSGSSHHFVSEHFLRKAGIEPVPAAPKQVKVANGENMISDKCVPQLRWWCNGHTLITDMRVLDLGANDAILGYDWLKSHSPMNCDWEKRVLQFEERGRMITLQGVKAEGLAIQELSARKLMKWYKGNDLWALVLLTQEASDKTAVQEKRVQAVLEKFKDVFEDPKTLPPTRTYDHTIPLLPGAVPVNSRPYRYSPQHKDEIERQEKAMLQSGLFVPSTSPFASPVC